MYTDIEPSRFLRYLESVGTRRGAAITFFGCTAVEVWSLGVGEDLGDEKRPNSEIVVLLFTEAEASFGLFVSRLISARLALVACFFASAANFRSSKRRRCSSPFSGASFVRASRLTASPPLFNG